MQPRYCEIRANWDRANQGLPVGDLPKCKGKANATVEASTFWSKNV